MTLAKDAEKKRTLRILGGRLHKTLPLTQGILEQLLIDVDAVGDIGMADMVVTLWALLLRVVSEGITLEAGDLGEAMALSPSRHSAVWIDASYVLCVRLQRRKHRPHGSALKSPCECATLGRQFCIVHRLQRRLYWKTVGSLLWVCSPSVALNKLRNALGLLEVPSASAFTFKCFRAGKATVVAAEGDGLGTILTAGSGARRQSCHTLTNLW